MTPEADQARKTLRIKDGATCHSCVWYALRPVRQNDGVPAYYTMCERNPDTPSPRSAKSPPCPEYLPAYVRFP